MRIFVTGGSGFLGSRMIRTLVAQEHQVFALARSTSSDRAGSHTRGDTGYGRS